MVEEQPLSVTKKTETPVPSIIPLDADDTEPLERILTNIGEFDRVVGGGIVPGSTILIGGDPGIGKSTLMLQVLSQLEQYQPLYVTGEESVQQIRARAARLGILHPSIGLVTTTSTEAVLELLEQSNTRVMVIDSIQTMATAALESAPGSIAQIRESAALLTRAAKQHNVALLLIGHITKEGALAGPKVLEHIVDTVLQFEGERFHTYRLLRALKNRYGSTNELGIFEMTDRGLREVPNPSEFFLSAATQGESGSVITIAVEGSRPLALEVQSLVTPSSYATPQRSSMGFDIRRLHMLIAVLEKRLGLALGRYDVFVNIAGGMRTSDPGVDFAVATAIISSLRDIPVAKDLAVFGEIGLTGEIRPVHLLEQRVNEAVRLGMKTVYAPQLPSVPHSLPLQWRSVERLVPAIVQIFGKHHTRQAASHSS